MDVSVEKMDEIVTDFATFLWKKMLAMMNDKKMEHRATTVCHLCCEKFNQKGKNFAKVKDHCHYTGKYWGATHLICNLKYVPVLAHNSFGYDNHLILPRKEFNFLCVGENTKRLISFFT